MTVGLIVVNIVAYLWEESTKVGLYSLPATYVRCADKEAVCKYALYPDGVHHGQWYRLITAAFLHANFEHIALNMITLFIVGVLVEHELGSVRFLALYVVSALGGSVASYLLGTPQELGLGASGAIFGLMGAFFVLARRRGLETGGIVGLIVINLVLSFSVANIDWRAHVGGLVVGGILAIGLSQSMGRGFAGRRTNSRSTATAVETLTSVATLSVVTAVLLALVLLPPGKFHV